MKRRDSASLYGKAVYCTVEQSKNILRQILDCWCMGFSWINGFWYNQGGLLYLRKLDPQNISFRLCPTYMDGHTHTHTHAHTDTHTILTVTVALLCYAVGGWSGLCGPSWISLSTLAGPHSACCRLLPQPWARAASRPADQPPWTPAKLLTPPWVVPLHAALAWPVSNPPPPPPPLWLPQQPQTTSLCSQCGAPLRTSQSCKLYFYRQGGCGCTVFLRVFGEVKSEKRMSVGRDVYI